MLDTLRSHHEKTGEAEDTNAHKLNHLGATAELTLLVGVDDRTTLVFNTARNILTGALGRMSERQSGSTSDRTMRGVDLSSSNELDMTSSECKKKKWRDHKCFEGKHFKIVAANRKGKDFGSHLWIRQNSDALPRHLRRRSIVFLLVMRSRSLQVR